MRDPLAHAGLSPLARQALAVLRAGWEQAFAPAMHVMHFPRAQGFQGEQERYTGDVFARALITDALQDADAVLGGELGPMIAREIAYLIGVRRQDGIGGWSYFPDLIELPPDIDDLAQVMLALMRAGQDPLRYGGAALETALRDGSGADGAIDTWIIPRGQRSAAQACQSEWVRLAWGGGPDVEVMANLLHVLGLLDGARHAQAIVAGANYIAARQEHDGAWRSSWYHGPFYGTYQCLRLLAGIVPHHPAVRRACAFLLERQRPDGAWGLQPDGDGDPLSTALAVLALHASRCAGHLEAARAGLRSMAALGQGAPWPAVPFIRMDLGRASGHVHQTLTYQSDLVTSAFVLKAACAVPD